MARIVGSLSTSVTIALQLRKALLPCLFTLFAVSNRVGTTKRTSRYLFGNTPQSNRLPYHRRFQVSRLAIKPVYQGESIRFQTPSWRSERLQPPPDFSCTWSARINNRLGSEKFTRISSLAFVGKLPVINSQCALRTVPNRFTILMRIRIFLLKGISYFLADIRS